MENENNNNNGNEDANEERFNFSDNPLEDLNPGEDESEAGADKGDDKKDDKSGDDKISPAVQAALDKMEESRIGQEQTIQFLRGQITTLEKTRQEPERKEDKQEEPLFRLPDKAKLQVALSDPESATDTLMQMFKDFGESITGRIKQTEQSTGNELSRRDQQVAFERALNADRKEAIDEFGEKTLGDPEFIADADKEIERIIRLRGGKSYLPGDFYTAAARTYSKRMLAGKITKETNGAVKTESERPSLREVTRRVSSDHIETHSNGDARRAPTKLSDIPFASAAEERVARLTMKKLGVNEADFVRNYIAGQREGE